MTKTLSWVGDNCIEVSSLFGHHGVHHQNGVLIIHMPQGELLANIGVA